MVHMAEATEVHRGHLHNANRDLGQVCHQGRGDIKHPNRPCFALVPPKKGYSDWRPNENEIFQSRESSLMENGEKPTECLAGPCRTALSGFRCRDHQLLRTKWDCGSIMHIIGSSGGEEKVVEVPHAQSNNAFNGRERSKNPIFENEAECPTKISFVLYISCDDLGIILKCLHVCMSTDWLFPLKWLKLVPVPGRQWYEKGIAVSVLWVERFAAASFYNPMIKNHPAAAAAASTAAIAAL